MNITPYHSKYFAYELTKQYTSGSIEATRDVEKKKDELLDNISKRLEQKINKKELFTVRWELK